MLPAEIAAADFFSVGQIFNLPSGVSQIISPNDSESIAFSSWAWEPRRILLWDPALSQGLEIVKRHYRGLNANALTSE